MTGVSSSDSSPSLVFLPGAEAALIGLTLVTVLGFWRVFDRSDFLLPMLAVAVVAHLVMLLARRRGWGVPVTAAVSAPVTVLVGIWLIFPTATAAGIPTGATAAAIVDSLQDAWRQFGNILAPAPPEPGFVVASCVALYFAVLLADWAAFRLWSSFEAVVPATTLFLFCALLGAGHQVVSASLFIAALLLFLLLHRIARQESSSGWLTGEPVRAGSPSASASGRRGPVALGAALVATAVVAGTVIGPILPGAGSPAVVPWRNNGQTPGERRELSPLVNLRDRLLKQTDTPLFTVESEEKAYWRLTALDMFDGEIWKSQAQFEEVDDELPGEVGAGEADQLEQRFTIENLDKIWAPVAFKPTRLIESKVDLSYNEELSTLILKQHDDTLRGATYTVQSKTTQPSADMLKSVTAGDIPEEIREQYTALPEDFSERARRTANEVVNGTNRRPYEVARALQDFFRGGSFRYNPYLELRHDESAIDTFLRDRQGFCEQFAGTYAAMARSLGLPARVAVGFTPGAQSAEKANVYHVTGRQSHVWPEVYLGKYGWVMFEPTPGRGAPNAGWTGVSEDQDTGTTPLPTQPAGSAPGTVPSPGPVPPTAPEPETTTTLENHTEEPTTESRRGALTELLIAAVPILIGIAVVGLGLLGALALYMAVLSSLRERRRRERRAWATNPSRRVLVAWEECVEDLRSLGLVPFTSESHDEFALRAAPRLGDAGPDLVALADAANHADYARDLVEDEFAGRAAHSAAVVSETANLLRTPMQQWAGRLDPRPLLHEGRRPPQHTISVGNPT